MTFTMFEDLVTAVRALGIDVVAQSAKIFHSLATDGVEVTSEQDFIRTSTGIFHVLPNGRVIKVILHITQKSLYTRDEPGIEDYHRYHLFNCGTLQMMESIGRAERYRVASRGDGRFRYTLIRHNHVVREFRGEDGAPLQFCRNCLRIYNRTFNRRHRIPFDLKRFIETDELHGSAKVTPRLDSDDSVDTYAHDWRVIAARYKTAKAYRCEECGIDLSAARLQRFLQAHHGDGQKMNNEAMNIHILCIVCHAKQPFHQGLIPHSPAYAAFLQTDEYQRHSALQNGLRRER